MQHHDSDPGRSHQPLYADVVDHPEIVDPVAGFHDRVELGLDLQVSGYKEPGLHLGRHLLDRIHDLAGSSRVRQRPTKATIA